MKRFKQIVIAAVLFSSGLIMAQDNPKPRFENDGNLIKGTFYYENGSIKQEGTYKNGKLHGKWVSYNQRGEKETIAQYAFGNKTGKWFFWHNSQLTEVHYKENKITRVIRRDRD
ncbi:toxin-antitoxin system YwqK family antitoxin [Salegentibacter sp. F14]